MSRTRKDGDESADVRPKEEPMVEKKYSITILLSALILIKVSAFAQIVKATGKATEALVKTGKAATHAMVPKVETTIIEAAGREAGAAALNGVGNITNRAVVGPVSPSVIPGEGNVLPATIGVNGNIPVIPPLEMGAPLPSSSGVPATAGFPNAAATFSVTFPNAGAAPYAGGDNITTAADFAIKNNIVSIPLTNEEKALLPQNGKVQGEVRYNFGGIGKAEVRPVPQPQSMEVFVGGKEELSFLVKPELVDFTPYFFQLTDKAVLDETAFPHLWEKNLEILEKSLKHSMTLTESVINNPLFYQSLQGILVEKTPYLPTKDRATGLLPSSPIDYVFVGEIHYNPLMHEELLELLRAVKAKYPSRNVYLATEYGWESNDWLDVFFDLPPLAKATNQKELRELLGDSKYVELKFLHDAINEGIPVVGLEPRLASLQYVSMELPGKPSSSRALARMKEFATSAYGLKWRNERWIKHIEQIRKEDPNALVVVHGGAQHTSFHELTSVANQLKGKSFSVALMDERGREMNNPVYATLEDQQFIWHHFESAYENRYVLAFKKPDVSKGLTPENLELFKQALGADVVVYLKDLSSMIIP